tara:strand:- start:3852 stop:6734 length:2883 start_codon:yes stop_codon:yes gene_type:complete
VFEIRRGIATRHYENSFFRTFAKNLKYMFDKYEQDGLLIANAECVVDDRLQIDTLLITKHVVCIIDFKNFSGNIILPNEDNFYDGIWSDSKGTRIKGGSSINPYKQLMIQKKKFRSITTKYIEQNLIENDIFNPRHVLKIVCFQNTITLEGNIPSKDKIDFFIVDENSYLEQIKDIIDISDNQINLSVKSYNSFKEVFKANKFDLEESYSGSGVVEIENKSLDSNLLYNDQKLAIQEISDFIKSDTENVFILNGSTNSGKTHLISYIEELAYEQKIQEVKKIVQSKRIANNLSSNSSKFDSMYSYIYGGNSDLSEVNIDEFRDDNSIEIIPLKDNDDEETCLYIVDEAQLITDSFYKSINMQFGTGHLLKDFINYVTNKSKKRKIVFIGDSYQLLIGSKEKSCLNGQYLEKVYDLKIKYFNLLDKPKFSVITKEALICVNSINMNKYNNLNFEFDKSINIIEKKSIKDYISKNLESDFKTIVFSNKDAQKINLWIKNTILLNGNDLNKGDLVLINNNIVLYNNDPWSDVQKIYNGQFAIIETVSNNIEIETISIKGKFIELKFREVKIYLKDTNKTISVLSFENYRLNEKNELSEDETIAYNIFLNNLEKELFLESNYFLELKQISINTKEELFFQELIKDGRKGIEKGNLNQKEIKSKLSIAKKQFHSSLQHSSSSKYNRYKNAIWLKFGWALTVHKSVSYKWDNVLINTEQGNNGKANENYFRWIYTALTRAKKEIKLINYKPINPYIQLELKEATHSNESYFVANENYPLSSDDIIVQNRLNFPENRNFLLEFYNMIQSKLLSTNIKVKSILHPPWQEQYEFSENNESAIFSIYYNGKQQFKVPKLISSTTEKFKEKIFELILEDNEMKNLDFIEDLWKKEAYTLLLHALSEEDIICNYIIENDWKDTLKFSKNKKNLIFDAFYNGDGFFTKATIGSKDKELVDSFINIVARLSGDN